MRSGARLFATQEPHDHRQIGVQQQLWMQHPLSPGSAFFLPHGMRILSRLQGFLRGEYRRRGYDEVETPQLYAKELWETSGHWEHYHADMFGVACGAHSVDSEPSSPESQKEHLALKPMNCPAHCLIFGSTLKSYRDLPIRVADFGALHRNEARGALTGLTRLRRFHQDDAHIFCTKEQLHDELVGCLQFLQFVRFCDYVIFFFPPFSLMSASQTYQSLSLPFEARLATRPSSVLGDAGDWDEVRSLPPVFVHPLISSSPQAESALVQALRTVGMSFTEDRGGGAFYAPKIDFAVTDAHGRAHQCGTIQADFQLPRRFDLRYVAADGADRAPVLLHRAILGSLERFVAILAEHTGGRWPLWLSPRQVAVCTVADRHGPAAHKMVAALREADVFADVDSTQERVPNKVRVAQGRQYNYIAVLGDREAADGTITPRTRDGVLQATMPLADFVARLRDETARFC
jgi:threonyl-tRNA synthetase